MKIKDENLQLEHLPKGFLQQLATTGGFIGGASGVDENGQEDPSMNHMPATTITAAATASSSSSSSIAAIVQEIATKSELESLHSSQQKQQLIHLPHAKAPANTVITAVQDPQGFSSSLVDGSSTFVDSTGTRSLIRTRIQEKPKPQWHAPWKLMRVLSGHLGWVRCVAVDPSNEWFATGSADRVIKVGR